MVMAYGDALVLKFGSHDLSIQYGEYIRKPVHIYEFRPIYVATT